MASLSHAKFFRLQSDSSTDASNVEIELDMVVYSDPLSNDGTVQVRGTFFAVRHLNMAEGQGLFDAFVSAVEYVGIKD